MLTDYRESDLVQVHQTIPFPLVHFLIVQKNYLLPAWLIDWMVWMFTKLYPSQHPTAPIVCQPACVCVSACRGHQWWVLWMGKYHVPGWEGVGAGLWLAHWWHGSDAHVFYSQVHDKLAQVFSNPSLLIQIKRMVVF